MEKIATKKFKVYLNRFEVVFFLRRVVHKICKLFYNLIRTNDIVLNYNKTSTEAGFKVFQYYFCNRLTIRTTTI
jgi:hypothetical protein